MVGNLPVILNANGGKIVVDKRVLALWQEADGKNLSDLDVESTATESVNMILACLAEAGLLSRAGVEAPQQAALESHGDLVSVVIVSYNSLEWLEPCLNSLSAQTYSPIEVIVVDNASQDETADWIKTNYPDIVLLRIEKSYPLATAINRGIITASGRYFLILNPDVQLETDAVAHLVAVANQDQSCAAVAAKLRFTWAPQFLNGIGNSVGALSWGTDNCLGHLDLGQFDHWREVPSACFAATLIPKEAWQAVGTIDQSFPMYYEDSEWSYRARLFGYKVRTAPQAVVYHAFGSRIPAGADTDLSPAKLKHVVYGRLRFISKILGPRYFLRFLFSYLIEDIVRLGNYLLHGRWGSLYAYIQGWLEYLNSMPEIRSERRNLQSRRAVPDVDLFQIQKGIPVPLLYKGLPQLTRDIAAYHYLPLRNLENMRSLPEFEHLDDVHSQSKTRSGVSDYFRRIIGVVDNEGNARFFYRIFKHFQWYLRRP